MYGGSDALVFMAKIRHRGPVGFLGWGLLLCPPQQC